MSAMTLQAFALLVASPICNPAHLPLEALQGHAVIESGLDPAITHVNLNHTIDYGLFQINEVNFARLNLTPQTALDPCRNMVAEETVLLSTYNSGRPTASVPYAMNVFAAISRASSPSTSSTSPTSASEPFGPPRPAIHLRDQIASFSRPR